MHSDAADATATDWRQIVALYDQLLALSPSPVVALHRAVAVGEVDGPAVALDLVEALDLPRSGDLLRRARRSAPPPGPDGGGCGGVRGRCGRHG